MANLLERIDLKVFIDAPEDAELDPILTVFDRWRQEADASSDWIDLADYAHMKRGPGVMMAGKREHFAIDTNEPGLGILCSIRAGLSGTNEERMAEAFQRHLALATRLIGEPEWPGDFSVRSGEWKISINDRLGFPNTDENDAALRPALEAAAGVLFGSAELTRDDNPQRRLGWSLRAEGSPSFSDLKDRVNPASDRGDPKEVRTR